MMKIQPVFLLLIFVGTVSAAYAQEEVDTLKIKPYYHEVNFFVEDNEGCLKCHGEQKYSIIDSMMERSITKKMYSELYIDRDDYYGSVHKSFSCTDCHSYDFYTYPHSYEARTEAQLVCMDCHGYDESFAQYQFEGIEMEFTESIHNMEEFTCWKCHNPHSYQTFMRETDDFREAIVHSNNMCLKCHSDYDEFVLYSERDEVNILDKHDWLPNQPAHFASMRCIECHTEINDSIFIAHKILSSESAVKNCAECHSQDSRLMHTLYKFQSVEERQAGLINGVILKNSFVIGANQNVFLNWLSFIILGCTLLGILVHTIMRIIK